MSINIYEPRKQPFFFFHFFFIFNFFFKHKSAFPSFTVRNMKEYDSVSGITRLDSLFTEWNHGLEKLCFWNQLEAQREAFPHHCFASRIWLKGAEEDAGISGIRLVQ